MENNHDQGNLIAAIEKQGNLSHKQAEQIINITFDAMINSSTMMNALKLVGLDLSLIETTRHTKEEIQKQEKLLKYLPKKSTFL